MHFIRHEHSKEYMSSTEADGHKVCVWGRQKDNREVIPMCKAAYAADTNNLPKVATEPTAPDQYEWCSL